MINNYIILKNHFIVEWIELSPYEVFMPRYGVAIDMKNFGDRFYGGFITKEYGEEPIHFLQGINFHI